MSALLILLYIAAEPRHAASEDITMDAAEAAWCIAKCFEEKAKKAATVRKGKGGGKKAKPAEQPAPQQSDRDQRVDALEKDVSRLERDSAEHDALREELKKHQENVQKYWLTTREAAATDHVKQQEQLDQLRKDTDANKSALDKLRQELGGMYGLYDKYNLFSVKVGLRPSVLMMRSLDGTSFSGVSMASRLTLNLRKWAGVYGEGAVVGAISDRPVSTSIRGGVNVFPLSWTNIRGVEDIGIEIGLSGTWAEIGERLKARSTFICLEVGPIFRWVFIERWLALSAGMNVLAGGEWDQGHPALTGGFAGAVALEF